MSVYYQDESVTLYHGEALAVLASLPTGSVDAVVADPPYSSGGMMRGDRAQATVAKRYQCLRCGIWRVKKSGRSTRYCIDCLSVEPTLRRPS